MAAPRFAVLLHGKVGGLKSDLPALEGRREEPSESPRAFDNAAASPAMLALCAASVERLVVSPNRGQYAVDVLGHSWSPEVGPLLDALFSPAASTHEQPVRPTRCPNASSWDPRLCHRTRSHMLGIQRALLLKASHEARAGFVYDGVLLSRWDVLWNAPLVLRRLPHWQDARRRARTVYLPRHCTLRGAALPPPIPSRRLRHGVCGGLASEWHVPQPAAECSRLTRSCSRDMQPAAREAFLLDW